MKQWNVITRGGEGKPRSEFYAATLDKWSDLRMSLPYDRNAVAVAALLGTVASEDDEDGKVITEYLSTFELLACGVLTDIFDQAVIERIAGGRIRAVAANYGPWIRQWRETHGNQKIYLELESLAALFEARSSNSAPRSPGQSSAWTNERTARAGKASSAG